MVRIPQTYALKSCKVSRKPTLADCARLWIRVPEDTAFYFQPEPIIQKAYNDARAIVTLCGNPDLAAAYTWAIKSRAVKL